MAEEPEVHRPQEPRPGDSGVGEGFPEGQPEWAWAGHPGVPQAEEEESVGAFLALSHVIERRRWEDGVCHSLVTSPYLGAASLGAPETGAGEDPRDPRAGQAKGRLPRAGVSALDQHFS